MAGERVVVAMSGGVDSSASALLLHEQGYSVIGVSMQVWDYRKNGGSASRASCCAPSDFEDARVVAEGKGFPFYVFDFEDSFQESVIDPFVHSYLKGLTPNPCLDCNRKVKFRELRRRAANLGAKMVATGHYVQTRVCADGTLGLFTARDKEKDQSYFLYALTQEDLKTTHWPVGSMTKAEVREYLKAQGVAISDKEESQDICFVSGSLAEFIRKYAAVGEAPGDIVDGEGKVVGTHPGVFAYTVGQRRGLGISNSRPLYVIDIDADSNRITVGPREELERESFFVGDVSWVSGRAPSASFVARVKVRYRHPGVRCRIESADDSCWQVSFLDGWTAVSPGQAAVFYDQVDTAEGLSRVLGGGIIQKGGYE